MFALNNEAAVQRARTPRDVALDNMRARIAVCLRHMEADAVGLGLPDKKLATFWADLEAAAELFQQDTVEAIARHLAEQDDPVTGDEQRHQREDAQGER